MKTAVVMGLALAVFLQASAAAPAAQRPADRFPDAMPATLRDAIALLQPGPGAAPCDLPAVPLLRRPAELGDPSVRRAWAMARGVVDSDAPPRALVDGALLRLPDSPVLPHRRLPAADRLAASVEAVATGVHAARQVLVQGLQLRAPLIELTITDLGDGLDGYVLAPDQGEAIRAVISSSPCGGVEGVRRAAIHAYAEAVALAGSPEFPTGWSRALATWTRLKIEGRLDAATAALFSSRLAALGDGLDTPDARLAPGNALWLAFLEQAYGPVAVRATAEELARGPSVRDALDRAVRRVSNDGLEAAFREFHIGAVLAGTGNDPREFPWADRLTGAAFASAALGLPALSVYADPPVAPLGAAHVRLRGDRDDGGLSVRFEAEFPAHWQADLVLVGTDGTLRRLALEVSAEGRGLSTVPLQGLEEAWLLLRNLDAAPARYTYAIHRERGFPFELASLQAQAIDRGVLVSWETSAEQRLLGFNVLRVLEDGGQVVPVNPVWVPALGTTARGTSYHFLDTGANRGESYLYRIEGVTVEGLSSHSDPVLVPSPLAAR